jgi:hypothetical protein
MLHMSENAPGRQTRAGALGHEDPEVARTRRNVLGIGFGAGVGVIGLGIGLSAQRGAERLRQLGNEVEQVRLRTRLEALSKSHHFLSEVNKEKDALQRHGKLKNALKNGRVAKAGDGRSCIDFIRETLMDGVTDEELPTHIRNELSDLFPGLPVIESVYDNNEVGKDGERTLSQILPEVYQKKKYGSFTDEQIMSLENQVIVMRRMAIEAYTEMKQQIPAELERIQTTYFGTSEEDKKNFECEFLALAILNSRQVGLGNMLEVIRKFAHEPKRAGIRHYDVFHLMTKLASRGSYVSRYKKISGKYTLSVFAAADLLSEEDTSAV